jgi:hypothetical protein
MHSDPPGSPEFEKIDAYIRNTKLRGIVCHDLDITVISSEHAYLVEMSTETVWRFGRDLVLGMVPISIHAPQSILVPRRVALTLLPLRVTDVLVGRDLLLG